MSNFILKELTTPNIESELEKIGFDIAYRAKASDKFRYKTIKIFNLTLPQANILKQTALSYGADCGVHRDVLINKIEKTDVIIGGSFSQLKKICEKLKQQPFSLKLLAEKIESLLKSEERKTKLVGILNLTPDSFSNDGILNEKRAIEKLYKLIEDGADMIDIGAESSRPGSLPIEAKEQIKRLKLVTNEFKNISIPISIDTKNSEVARFCLDNGALFINDVSGGEYDNKMFDTVSEYQAGYIIQHSTGNAENKIEYNDVIEDVYNFLNKKLEFAHSKNIKNIILDIGIGFGKTKEQNFELINRIEEFYSLKTPIMIGVSRKSLLGVENDDNNTKDALSAAISYPLILKNIDYIRVHNIKLHKQLLNLAI